MLDRDEPDSGALVSEGRADLHEHPFRV